tara:strand:- start:1638 stop:1988 length:351 start_codon:yes stop_codon:yes gene_type:complete
MMILGKTWWWKRAYRPASALCCKRTHVVVAFVCQPTKLDAFSKASVNFLNGGAVYDIVGFSLRVKPDKAAFHAITPARYPLACLKDKRAILDLAGDSGIPKVYGFDEGHVFSSLLC